MADGLDHSEVPPPPPPLPAEEPSLAEGPAKSAPEPAQAAIHAPSIQMKFGGSSSSSMQVRPTTLLSMAQRCGLPCNGRVQCAASACITQSHLPLAIPACQLVHVLARFQGTCLPELCRSACYAMPCQGRSRCDCCLCQASWPLVYCCMAVTRAPLPGADAGKDSPHWPQSSIWGPTTRQLSGFFCAHSSQRSICS